MMMVSLFHDASEVKAECTSLLDVETHSSFARQRYDTGIAVYESERKKTTCGQRGQSGHLVI